MRVRRVRRSDSVNWDPDEGRGVMGCNSVKLAPRRGANNGADDVGGNRESQQRRDVALLP